MAQIILIRHAQASLGSSNYDQLSQLGHRQASMLGDYFSQKNLMPSKIISGTLKRHIETSQAISNALSFNSKLVTDERWNEFDFKNLLKAYIRLNHDDPIKFTKQTDPKVFFAILKKAMQDWAEDKINTDEIETWKSFSQRIVDGLNVIAQESEKDETILLTSSGGAISMAMKYILGIEADKMIDLNFEIKNASYSTINIKRDRFVLSSFNQIPHLEIRGESGLITYA